MGTVKAVEILESSGIAGDLAMLPHVVYQRLAYKIDDAIRDAALAQDRETMNCVLDFIAHSESPAYSERGKLHRWQRSLMEWRDKTKTPS